MPTTRHQHRVPCSSRGLPALPLHAGDRRRAYQRMRYAARQAAATEGSAPQLRSTTTTKARPHQPPRAPGRDRAAVDEVLTALKDPDRCSDSDVQEAYLNAVLHHGAALRDITDQKINQVYAQRGLDDVSVNAETAAVAAELEHIESQWRDAKKRTDTHLSADGISFTPDGAAAIDDARNAYATAKQDIYRRALARSKEINELRAQLAKQVYYEELSRERSFGGPAGRGDSSPPTSPR